jgi:hypothetical protein
MKNSLPSLAVLLWIAASASAQGPNPANVPASAPPAPPAAVASEPLGDKLIAQAVANLDAAPSLTAKIRHRIELMGRPLIGTGDYAQQGRGAARAFRLDLQLRTSLSATSIEHVCNGQQLWMFEELDGHEHLTVIDVARLHRGIPKPKVAAPSPMAWLSLGGLPKLLIGLQESFRFGHVVESRLDDLRVWTVEGRWNPARLAQLLPDQAAAINSGGAVDLSQLTPNVPHRVVLHVGADDLFPYRIEYWRSDSGDKETAPSEKLMAVMEWYEVQIGARIDPARFAYQPPEKLIPNDRTKEWLDRLGLSDAPPAEANRRLRTRL